MEEIKAFKKRVASLFVVSTPFQALCALATLKQLEISDYRIIAHLPQGNVRNEQLRAFLYSNGLKFTSYTPNKLSSRYYRWLSFMRRHNGYDRLFVGNFNDVPGFLRACHEIKDGASIVYLDDGNNTVSLFRGMTTTSFSSEINKRLAIIRSKRQFVLFRNFLTIYGDIKNQKYNIEELKLNHIVNNNFLRNKYSGIYIIGTVIEEVCKTYNIQRSYFINQLKILFELLLSEYPSESIVYIPHGRDSSEYAQALCREFNVEFRECETMVEIELMRGNSYPKAVYGYTSSALFSIKGLFSQTKVVNILCDVKANNQFYREIVEISKYYREHGIETITL